MAGKQGLKGMGRPSPWPGRLGHCLVGGGLGSCHCTHCSPPLPEGAGPGGDNYFFRYLKPPHSTYLVLVSTWEHGPTGWGEEGMGCANVFCGKELDLHKRTAREGLSRWVKPKMSNFLSWHEADPLPEMEEGKGSGRREARVLLLHSPNFLFPLPSLWE